MRWTRKGIVAEIFRLYETGAEMNYASAERDHLNLVRAAAWHFGTWRLAVETAGLDYPSLSKYRRWGRERITARIRELHAQGADLSWRAISLEVDPPLAAAALRSNGYATWAQALAAAGIDVNDVARYQQWNEERVLREIQAAHKTGVALSSKAAQQSHSKLFCAARRRFGSWDEALRAAGLEAESIRLRQSGKTPSAKARNVKTPSGKRSANGKSQKTKPQDAQMKRNTSMSTVEKDHTRRVKRKTSPSR